MKKTALIIAVCIVIAFAGCTAGQPPQTSAPSGENSSPSAKEPNARVVKEEAPVTDTETGEQIGTAYKGFVVGLQEPKDGKATFSLSWMDEKGENVAQIKTYAVDTQFMEKKYVEPRAVIMMISADMIKLKAGASFYGEDGEKLITFSHPQGPFHFIQKTDKGYMMTLDMNIVYAREKDTEYIAVPVL